MRNLTCILWNFQPDKGNNEEKQALEEKVSELNKRVADKQAIKKTISEQLRKLQDNLRR